MAKAILREVRRSNGTTIMRSKFLLDSAAVSCDTVNSEKQREPNMKNVTIRAIHFDDATPEQQLRHMQSFIDYPLPTDRNPYDYPILIADDDSTDYINPFYAEYARRFVPQKK